MSAKDEVVYEVRFRGVLEPRWADWFEGFQLSKLDSGDSLLVGPVRDQSDLHGVLEKIAGLNLKLISVNVVSDGVGRPVDIKNATNT